MLFRSIIKLIDNRTIISIVDYTTFCNSYGLYFFLIGCRWSIGCQSKIINYTSLKTSISQRLNLEISQNRYRMKHSVRIYIKNIDPKTENTPNLMRDYF